MNLTFDSLLSDIPQPLREELFIEFNKILKNYRESRWEPTELEGGRISEIIYTIIVGFSSGVYPLKSSKPVKFYDACKKLESLDNNKFSRSVRVHMPRVLIALYEVRNNRGVGHVGGDVNSNHMDATYVISCVKWLMAELIRIFHQVDINVAAASIELIIQRETQIVWRVGQVKRVLNLDLGFKEKTLLLLYDCVDGTSSDQELFEWVEYSSKPTFRTNILRKAHADRLLEYTEATGAVRISPKGIQFVEDAVLKK